MEIDIQKFDQMFDYITEKYGADFMLVFAQFKKEYNEMDMDISNPVVMAYLMTLIGTLVLYIEQNHQDDDAVVSELLRNFNPKDF